MADELAVAGADSLRPPHVERRGAGRVQSLVQLWQLEPSRGQRQQA
jgi:hypothetical protein